MATIEQGIRSQIQNIEATYGRSVDTWIELIRASGLSRHGEIVAMLKTKYSLRHGAANRVALVALDTLKPPAAAGDPRVSPDQAERNSLLTIHGLLMTAVHRLGPDVEVAPKKGYLSFRRRKQFAMLKQAAKHIDVGLILPGKAVTDRLESATTFNALFTHRVRVRGPEEVDDTLLAWLREAYDLAG